MATRYTSLGLLIPLLASCASTPFFVEPGPAQPTAKVRAFHTQPQAYYAAVATFDGASCRAKSIVGHVGGDNKDQVRIGMLDSKPPSAASIERRVLANEPLVIGPRQVFPTASWAEIMFALAPPVPGGIRDRQAGTCSLSSFVPQANEEYEVVMDFAPGKCSVVPYRLVKQASGEVVRDPVATTPTPISIKIFDLNCAK